MSPEVKTPTVHFPSFSPGWFHLENHHTRPQVHSDKLTSKNTILMLGDLKGGNFVSVVVDKWRDPNGKIMVSLAVASAGMEVSSHVVGFLYDRRVALNLYGIVFEARKKSRKHGKGQRRELYVYPPEYYDRAVGVRQLQA